MLHQRTGFRVGKGLGPPFVATITKPH
jgi:hypothetical protein